MKAIRSSGIVNYPKRGLSAQRVGSVEVSPNEGFTLNRCWVLPRRKVEYVYSKVRPSTSGTSTVPSSHLVWPECRRLLIPRPSGLKLGCVVNLVFERSLADVNGVQRAEAFVARVPDLAPEDRPSLIRRMDDSYSYTGSVLPRDQSRVGP